MIFIYFVHQTSGRSSPAREFYKRPNEGLVKNGLSKTGCELRRFSNKESVRPKHTVILKNASQNCKGHPRKVSKIVEKWTGFSLTEMAQVNDISKFYFFKNAENLIAP